jgi:K+-transporting ATPase ATPase C chain
MRRDLLTSAIAIVVLTVLLGVAYPLVVTGIGQVAFNNKANGSLIKVNGKVVGSRLIAQDFKGNRRYFQPRPSTATKYAADATAFTNLGPNSKDALKTFTANVAAYRKLEGLKPSQQVPIDAVTSSGSGIDPQISVTNAHIQARRVASVRGLPLAQVNSLIDQNTSGRFIGIFGERGVNVLELNLALDSAKR